MNVELFPCSGGIASGFRRAGIEFQFVVEWEAEHCESYTRNIGHRPVHMDVRELLWIYQHGFRFGEEIDLFVADPPCTPWSRAGKRLGVEDERDMLLVTTELIRLMRPRAYLIGNVPGLDDSTQWHHLQAALAPLKREGYCIRDFTTLDAADFGVPQRRIRPWWFGHLDGPCIRWPMPTHCDPRELRGSLDLLSLKPWVTCRDALGHLPPEQLGRPVALRYRGALATTEEQRKMAGKKPRASGDQEVAETIRARADAVLTSTFNRRHPPASPARTLGAKDRGQSTVLAFREPDVNRPPADVSSPHRTVTGVRDQALLEWPWNRPSTSVYAEDRIMPPGHHDVANLSQPNAVVLSELAATILQGFPEDWCFFGKTKRARWSQIGQAMPPPLAYAVGRSVREQLAATQLQHVSV